MYIGLPPANSDVETSFLCTAGVTAKLFNFCQLKKMHFLLKHLQQELITCILSSS